MTIQIRIDHYIHHELDERATQKLDQVLAQGATMSEVTDKIAAEVTETKGFIQSAITLINGIAGQIRSAKDDKVALDALADSLDADSSALAAAVAANTPAEPPAVEPTA